MSIAYGYDAHGNLLTAPKGYSILKEGTTLKKGDIYFDVFDGWKPVSDLKANTAGVTKQWTAWARTKKKD